VWGCGPDDPKIVFIGEAPGRDEDRLGQPFVGAAGHFLNWGLNEAGIFRHRVWITNVLACRPPNNDFHSPEAKEALDYCMEGFFDELDFLIERGVKVICKLGGAALDLLGVREKITEARGSVFMYKNVPLIPTFYPSYLNRMNVAQGEKGTPAFKHTWVADLKKVKEISETGWEPLEEHFNLNPTLIEIETYVARRIAQNSLVAVDVETTSLDPLQAKIVVIGLAHNPTTALSIPLLDKNGHEYWSPAESDQVRFVLRDLFTHTRLAFQNAVFDVRHLRANGFDVPTSSIAEDTLLAFHSLSPEFPAKLGFISSIYGKTPYWKTDFVKRDVSILKYDQQELRRYNLRDCVVLHQILPGLLSDLKETGTETIYREEALPLLDPIIRMMDAGIKLDEGRLKTYAMNLRAERKELEGKLKNLGRLPSSFNLSSDDDLRFFLFGVLPNKLKGIEEAMASKKRKNTKCFRELQSLLELKKNTKPLVSVPTSFHNRRTPGGKYTVNEQGLLALQRAFQNRLAVLQNLVRKSEEHIHKESNTRSVLEWLSLYRRYTEIDKLISTYTDFPVSDDGRVHTSFLIHGTSTGRLASHSPNLQNQPKEDLSIRRCFVAEEGCVFVSADYENLEVRVLAYESEDESLIRAFENKANIHDENTKVLFPDIAQDSPQWKHARSVAKVFMFGGISYGGGNNEIYERMILKAPELHLTFAQFKAAKQRFMDAHPAYKRWAECMQRTALETHKSVNHFGRIRLLLGEERDILKEALNNPIQSTAASIINRAMVRVVHRFDEENLKTKLLLQIHDELLFEVPVEEEQRLRTILKEEMEWKVPYGTRNIVFPIEIKTGPDWGSLK
jgi:DNA polymerase-1